MNNNRFIALVGAGSIGGFVATTLAYMARTYATRLLIFDYDTVEHHNSTNQIYRQSDVKIPKVIACAGITEFLAKEMDVVPQQQKVTEQDRFYGPVIVAVDSIGERRKIFAAVRDSMMVPLLIDARSGVGYGTVVALNPMDPHHADTYLARLPEDDETAPVPCANADSIPLLYAIASIVAQHVNSYYLKGNMFQYKESSLNYTVIGPTIMTSVVNTLIRK
ncbi:MAG: hypothetical protein Greene101415_1162 [Parcubacteria group bacterium Greene1014_15]|nr:MAG: hypothetical protein Greene101415_1162 [Parcubacteria group bacterium Greene1014_15]